MSTLQILPPIIAHRGACSHAPENTLAAFRKAKELGLSWVEFDVMLSSDGQAIVIHDDTLDRTTAGKGRVCDFAYCDLKNLDAGSWFNVSFDQERISTLEEILQLLVSLDMNANIEIKAQKGWEAKTVQIVLQCINKHWTKAHFPPLLSSFSYDILKCIRELSSTSLLGFLMHRWRANWRQQCDEINATAVDVNETILTQERAVEIKDTGRTLLAYTVNEPTRAMELFSWGVDAVFSDCPEPMLALI